MSIADHNHHLGEVAFVMGADGSIMRSAVSSLVKDGYSLLLGANTDRTFFNLEEAVVAARRHIEWLLEIGDITRVQEERLRERLTELDTPAYRQTILSQQLVKGSVFGGERQVLGENITFPSDYFVPGEEVFGLVAPSTHYVMIPDWRPKPYFLLKTVVEKVSFSAAFRRNLSYGFANTYYRFPADRIFSDEDEARVAMVKLFAEETGGTISPENLRIFEVQDEQTYWQQQQERRGVLAH